LPLLFHNAGAGKFEPVAAFSKPLVGRGAAYGDFDGDGDLDLLISNNNGPAVLYRNGGGNRNHWLQLKLTGTKSNRDAIGATVHIASAQGRQWQTVHSGSSYCSSSDLALTFGLGKDAVAASVDIDWPSGKHQKLANVKANQRLAVSEQ
jgi:enediyne biosynthesis protein E4